MGITMNTTSRTHLRLALTALTAHGLLSLFACSGSGAAGSAGSGSGTIQSWDDRACRGTYNRIACFDNDGKGGVKEVSNPGNVTIQCGCPAGTPNCP